VIQQIKALLYNIYTSWHRIKRFNSTTISFYYTSFKVLMQLILKIVFLFFFLCYEHIFHPLVLVSIVSCTQEYDFITDKIKKSYTSNKNV